MARWERWESGEMRRWEVPVFFKKKGWGMQGESKILSFLFLLVRGKNGQVGFKIFLHGSRDGKTLF